jgi:hypothetical protein
MARKKHKKKQKSKSTAPATTKHQPIKQQMTKKQLVGHITSDVEGQFDKLSTKDTKRLVLAILDSLTDVMQRSLMPKGAGSFIFPKVMKVILKSRPAIKKGTMVRSPATGGMVPSKGRPESSVVKIRALASLKKAASGDI